MEKSENKEEETHNKNLTKIKREIYLIRHGEREDDAKNKHKEEFETITIPERNSRLTSKGEYQAFITGRQIHSLLPKRKTMTKNHSVFILSSPYVRCVQSAVSIAAALKLTTRPVFKNTVYIVDNLKEYQNRKNFVSDFELERSYESLTPRFMIKLKKIELGVKMKKEVEDAPKSYVRVREIIDFMKTEDFLIEGEKPRFVICVTHAFFLLNMMLQYGKAMEANSPIDYCSLSKIEVGDGRDELSVVNSCDHIDDDVSMFGERSHKL